MKKVFIVIGNHDGNLGVFTNVKLAYERTLEYFDGSELKPNMSYAQVCKATKGWGCIIDGMDGKYTGDTSVTIQVHYLNQ